MDNLFPEDFEEEELELDEIDDGQDEEAFTLTKTWVTSKETEQKNW